MKSANKMAHSRQTAPFEKVAIPTTNGVSLSGWLWRPTKPITKTNCRIVIFVHGFAAEKTENGLFLEAAEKLVDCGYTVLTYDWRGLGDSGGDFSRTDLDIHVHDFKKVTVWVEKATSELTSRTCAVGFSLGATIVALAMQSGTKLGSAAFWSPAINPSKSMWPRYNTSEFKRQLETKGYIVKPVNPEVNVRVGSRFLASLRDTNLATSVLNFNIPLLVCHGTNDVRIPIQHNQPLYEQFNNDCSVKYREFVGASHSFRPEQEHRGELVSFLLEWLEKCSYDSKRSFQSHDRAFEVSPQKATSSDSLFSTQGFVHNQV